MRIISGSLRGLQVINPTSHKTHPMSERVRGALFNILGDLSDFKVLDAFAGSGILGFEAISRGATSIIATELDKKTYKILSNNVDKLELGTKVKAIHANVSSWSDKNSREKFDLILCDPPHNNMQLSTISKLTGHLKSQKLMVVCYSGRESTPNVNGVVVVDNRSYGDAALAFYRKVEKPV